MRKVSGWIAYSSYDLTDKRDGASQHLKDIYGVLGPELSADMLDMKRIGEWPRTSLGHALVTGLSRFKSWPWQWRDDRCALLLGMHSLLLAPFFAAGIYVPLDCWSAREAELSRRSRGLRGRLRRLYAMWISFCERLFLPFTASILVVSREEREAYCRKFPNLADRLFILPKRIPELGPPSASVPVFSKCAVAIWMDGRVSYGRDSIIQCLEFLVPWPDLSVTVLSRCQDLGVPLAPNQRNLPFVDDLDAFLRQQALVILPDIFGTGLKNRALEVAARGVRLMATSSALEGLDWSPSEQFVLSYSDRETFGMAIEEFFADKGAARAQALFKRIRDEHNDEEMHLISIVRKLYLTAKECKP